MDEIKRGWMFALAMNGVHNELERRIRDISEEYNISFHEVMKWHIKQLNEELQEGYYGKDE